jgi:oxygen-independent coproporphyrinogen-3 oxidase
MEQDGLITVDADGFQINPLGRLLMRNIAMCFDARLSGHQNQTQPRFSKVV